MNVMRSTCLRLPGARVLFGSNGSIPCSSPLHSFSSWVLSSAGAQQRAVTSRSAEIGLLPSWNCQQVRTVKRGTEYQPNNIKRKRTHGWIKRISTRGGIEVILRRMLKGRKSLTH